MTLLDAAVAVLAMCAALLVLLGGESGLGLGTGRAAKVGPAATSLSRTYIYIKCPA